MPLTKFKLSSIADGGISTAKLADDAVTDAKIVDSYTTGLKTNPTFTGTEGFKAPVGTTSQRANEVAGDQRFNSTTSLMEYYNGTNWKPIDSPPTVLSISPTTIADTSTSTSIVITGSSFSTGAVAKAIGTDNSEITAATTTVDNGSQITAVFNGTSFSDALEDYDIKVVAASGLAGVLDDVLSVNASPAFTTSTGTVATILDNWDQTQTNLYTSIATIAATDDEGASLTYALQSGDSLAGMALNSSTGVISGVPTEVSGYAGTTNQFDIEVTDGANTKSRSFNVVVKHVPHLFEDNNDVQDVNNNDAGSANLINGSARNSANVAEILDHNDSSAFGWHYSPWVDGATSIFRIDLTEQYRINRIINVPHANNMGYYTFQASNDASTWVDIDGPQAPISSSYKGGHFGGTNGGGVADHGRIINYFDNKKAYRYYQMTWVNTSTTLARLYDGGTAGGGWASYGILFQSTKYNALPIHVLAAGGSHLNNGTLGVTSPTAGTGWKLINPPFGLVDNYSDNGFIPATSHYDFDLGSSKVVDAVAIFSTFAGASRGGNVIIKRGTGMGTGLTAVKTIRYETFASGGTGSDSTLTRPAETNSNYGGEYIYDITSVSEANRTSRYWRLEFNSGYNLSGGHYPNTATMRLLEEVKVR